jgi:hypothetical protein
MFADRRVWAAGALIVTAVLLACSSALGQTDRWYPSRWGADDQRGRCEQADSAAVPEAKNVITKGLSIRLGHVHEPGMPMGDAALSLRICRRSRCRQERSAVHNDEVISGELGQIGTLTAPVISAWATCSTTAIAAALSSAQAEGPPSSD